jgi:hypothetical protein
MIHLTDQQLEEILQGTAPESAHLEECELCRGRLSEFRALQSRLRVAFTSVHADQKLSERVRSRLNHASAGSNTVQPGGKKAPSQIYRLFWRAAAAAAVLLLIAIPLSVYLGTPRTAAAAQAELVQIYQHSVSPHTELHADADPAKLAEYLKGKLGFRPAFPRLGAGMSLRGCCVTHFLNEPVGSYVVETPQGIISLIVVKQDSKSLGLEDKLRRGDHTYMAGSYAKCKMVTSELGGYTYCAVGEVPHAFLADLLDQLVLYGQD